MSPEPFEPEDIPSFEGQSFNESIDIALSTIQISQVEFSHMADSKANIMITVSSILMTLAVAKIEQGSLVNPSVALLIFCVPALIFAILCVMPSSAANGKTIRKTEQVKHFSPLFFMQFARLPVDRFEHELERVVTNPQELYQHLSRDIYYAGLVLRMKKFRYLRWSYIALMLGVVVSGLSLIPEVL